MSLNLVTRKSVHEIKLIEKMGFRVYSGPTRFKFPLLLLGFTNRSGSNLFAEYLRATEDLNGFHEQLNYDAVLSVVEKFNLKSIDQYIEAVSFDFVNYGFKASVQQIAMLLRFGATNLYPGVRILHIERLDTLGQAVSFSIADQTKQWTSHQERLREPIFDATDIERRLTGIVQQNKAFEILSTAFKIPYKRVYYENLLNNPLNVVQEAAEFFGVSKPTSVPVPKISVQSNDINRIYIEKFLNKIRDSVSGSVIE